MRTIALLTGLVLSLAAGLSQPTRLAAQAVGGDSSLTVTNAVAAYKVVPGDTLTHRVVVSLGGNSPAAVDVQVDARGLGQGLDGAPVALPPEQDVSPFSGRSFITSIDAPSFALKPGTSKTVTAVMVVPAAATRAGYYADLYIHTVPAPSEQLSIVRAVHVPIILTVVDTEITTSGAISSLDVQPPASGQPIRVSSIFKNTGSYHYKMNAEFTLTDSSGKPIETEAVPFSGSSLLPTFSRDFTASFTLLNRLEGLPPGDYGAAVRFTGPDGQPLDAKQATFKLTELYQPFPGIDPAHMKVVTFNDEEPGVIDARPEADTLLRFSGTGKVSGTVVIGKFSAEPKGIPYEIDQVDGGTGKQSLKFVGVGVQGFSKGAVNVNVIYRDDEVQSLEPNSLLLASRAGATGKWGFLNGLVAQTGAKNVAGDSTVAALNSNPVFGLGGDLRTGPAISPIILAVGGALLGGLVAGTGAVLYVRRRGDQTDDDDEEDGLPGESGRFHD